MLTSPPDSGTLPAVAGPAPVPVSEHPLAEAAEEVRAWFVQVRGGLSFLSSTDGRALVGWLEEGVPVTRILRAIDETAARRRARRSRRPFALIDIRPALAKGVGAAPRRAPRGAPAEAPGAEAVLAAVRALPGTAEERARAGCALAARFHEEVWRSLAAEHPALLAAAAAELAGLADAVDPDVFRTLCEEVARDRVRGRYPSLSAARIWEVCGVE